MDPCPSSCMGLEPDLLFVHSQGQSKNHLFLHVSRTAVTGWITVGLCLFWTQEDSSLISWKSPGYREIEKIAKWRHACWR